MKNITKPEIRFWMAIFSVLVVGIIAFVRLQGKVSAIETTTMDKGTKLRQEVEGNKDKLDEINDRLIRIETNQGLLMKAFNLEPVIE